MQSSRLDDPDYSALAWRRFRRLLGWMTVASAICGIVAAIAIKWQVAYASTFAIVGTGLGVFVSLMMAAALMGLVFFSAGSGHDEVVDNKPESLDP